jgi:hypothetical protein
MQTFARTYCLSRNDICIFFLYFYTTISFLNPPLNLWDLNMSSIINSMVNLKKRCTNITSLVCQSILNWLGSTFS